MSRLTVRLLALLLLALLFPGLDEVVENALHFVEQGHLAHARPAGDDHGSTNPEHDCTGAMHLCSCCATLSCLPGQVASWKADVMRPAAFLTASHSPLASSASRGVYRPPRA
jgi:hypothetical protein